MCFRVKFNKRKIGKNYETRDEAILKCKTYARTLIPPAVSPSVFKNTAVVFQIELLDENKKVISIEDYTEIIVMKK